MQIVIELTEAQVEALESHLTTQVKQVVNPLTGNVTMRPLYRDVKDFILSQTAVYVSNAMQMYPPESVQADMQAIKEAQERILEQARPTLAVPGVARP
jgi:translation initiation factor 2B subunit (eIF-2B alpha/beta/delta family)